MAMDLATEIAGKVKLTAEIGRAGPQVVGGAVYEEFDPDVRGLRGVRVYDEMRKNDPIVATGLRAIKWVIGQVTWRVEPGGQEDADKEAASFLETCMRDMSLTWTDVIQDALSCLAFGWAFMEVVYKQRNGSKGDSPSLYDDGKLGWRKLALIAQDTLREWKLDPEGGIQGLVQSVPWAVGQKGDRVIPIEKAVLFRLDKERNNPEGTSLLRSVYLPWYKKKQIEEIEAIGIERDLTGVLIIRPPMGATEADKNKAVDLLEQFKADDMTGFVAPQFGPGEHERWSFEIINSPGSKSIDTDKTIQRYQLEIMRAFLAQFLMLGQGGAGSWALSRDQRGMFELAIGSIVQSLEETINRFLVPPLFRFNDFGQLAALPQIKAGRVARADMERFGNALTGLVQVGVLTADESLERFVRDEMELPALVERTEKPKPEETGQGSETFHDWPEEWSFTAEEEEGVDWALDEPQGGHKGVNLLRLFQQPKRAPIDLLRAKIDKAQKGMEAIARDLKEGRITKAQWMAKFQVNLSDVEKSALQIAQRRLTPETRAIPRATRLLANRYGSNQLTYFRKLTDELDGLSVEKLAARSKMYPAAAEGLYHTVVKGGQVGKMATWHLGATENHCDDCPGRDGLSWLVEELPFVPRDGNSQCLNNCLCWLTYSSPEEGK